MKSFVSIAIVLLFFIAGVIANIKSETFVPGPVDQASRVSPSRDPAAIKRVYDFSNLEGSALHAAAKQRLINGAQVLNDNANIGVVLGHFVVRGEDGQKTFACQKYSRVILSFEGDGMIDGDNKPKMEVEGGCEVSPDINAISPLWIPVAKIMGEPVADGEFDFREGRAVKVRFANVSDRWPQTWVLTSIRLLDPVSRGQEVLVDSKELSAMMSKPLFVHFK